MKKGMKPRPLYIYRPVVNAKALIDWAKSNGFKSTLPADDLHITQAYSKAPVDWLAMGDHIGSVPLIIPEGQPRALEKFGTDGSAVVLIVDAPHLQARWADLKAKGCSWDWPDYSAHITLTWQAPPGLDITKIPPFPGEIELGPEVYEPLNNDWRDDLVEKETLAAVHKGHSDMSKRVEGIFKLDDEQRVAYGWASVITEKGQPVVDLQGDVITAAELQKATTDFMVDARKALAMHDRNADGGIDESMIKGMVVHSMPLTSEIAKSLGIDTGGREGWAVGVKVYDDAVWKDIKSGKLAAFSIGGSGDRVKIEDAA